MPIRTTLALLIGMLCLALIGGWLPASSSPRVPSVMPLASTSEQVILAPVADAYVDLGQPAGNFGSASTLDVMHFSATTRRALLRFNIAEAVPPQAVIDSAILELYLQNSEHRNTLALHAGLLSQDWVESEANWDNQPAHREPIVACSVDPTPGVYKQLDITAIARAWQNVPHYGLKLWGPEDTMSYGFWFHSREHETNHPRLIVQYHIPLPTPSNTWSPEPTPSATPTREVPPATFTPTPSITMPPDCPDLLLNGDLETGALFPWQASGPVGISWGRASTYGAWLGGQDNAVAQLDQAVSVPPGANPVQLDFWWLAEAEGDQPEDILLVFALYPTGADQLRTLRAVSPIGMWQHEVVDFSAYAGRLTGIAFTVYTDGALPSTFHIDDVRLLACGVARPTTTPTATPSSIPTRTPRASDTARPSPTSTPRPSDMPRPSDTPRVTRTTAPTSLPGYLPDLIITDVWNEGRTVCYQVRNIGQATAPGGHQTALSIDGLVVASNIVPVDLAPGARYRGCFDYAWSCSGRTDDVIALADVRNDVAESDESNNARQESWRCDTTPPRIIAGPTLRDITMGSVTIDWETDELSNSDVRYGRRAGSYDLVVGSIVPQMQHSVTVRPLEPATTYHFQVVSVDASGNGVTSGDGLFQTLSQEDDQNPLVTLLDPGTLRGAVIITATASDNTGVERIEFFLDDTLLHTDYSPPYGLNLDSLRLANGRHQLRARAYDLGGRSAEHDLPVAIANSTDLSAPVVHILSPAQGATVAGTIVISATASDDQGLFAAYWYIDGNYYAFEPFPSHPTAAALSLDWDTLKESEGSHRIGLMVYDTDNKSGIATCDVEVSHFVIPTPTATPTPGPPWLTVTDHRVTRSGHYFTVKLRVKNTGERPATNVKLLDGLQAFQPISKTVYFASYRPEWSPVGKSGYCEIASVYSIDPGQERTFEYDVVPVLLYPTPPTPQVGWFIDMSWDSAIHSGYHDYVQLPVATTTQGETIPQAHANACQAADYLIVTNPYRMGALYCPGWYSGPSKAKTEVNEVFSTMAELARAKHGVLGYLYDYSANTFKTLLKMNWKYVYSSGTYEYKLSAVGDWAMKLHPNFSTKLGGYVLIVGQTAVFPAFNLTGFDSLVNDVHDSDFHYTDTTGDHDPELIVGRIIGANAAALVHDLRTALNVYLYSGLYHYDASDALVFSGVGNYQDEMVAGVNTIASTLTSKGVAVSKYHEKDYADDTQRVQQFTNRVPGKDIIYMDAHGNPDSVGALDSTGISTLALTTYPVILANACLSGNYNQGDFAETLFGRGAGIYMGSTEISSVSVGYVLSTAFFQSWTPSKSVGYLFTKLKSPYANYGGKYRLWLHEYNYYGDPKYGITWPNAAPSEGRAPQSSMTTPPASLDVVVPAYEVTHGADADQVSIPGGATLFQDGRPQVPFYAVTATYPLGIKVQDVVLVERAGLVTDTGLNLPPFVDGYASTADTSPVLGNDGPEWFPERAYEWHTSQNPDGSTTLFVIMYPFFYNGLTTDVQFYRNYRFDIVSAESSAAITGLATDQEAYAQGEVVTVDMGLHNAGAARDVVIEAAIKRFATDEMVGGLLLQTLHGFEGGASFAPQWDSTSFPAGDYVVEVELRDAAGFLLDRKAEHFRLGILAAEAGDLTATPARFRSGDGVDLSLTVSNRGTVPLMGTAVIQVQSAEGGNVAQFRHPFVSLLPGSNSIFRDTWSTAGVGAGTYTVVGYAEYDAQATTPVTTTVSSQRTLQLPLVLMWR